MNRLPSDTRAGPPEKAPRGAGGSGGTLERHRGGELTPAEKKVRRRNRQWFMVIAIPAAIVGVAALTASIIADQSTPSVKPVSVPAGYKPISDGIFAYAVPSAWATNDLYSDNVGDLDTSGSTGWVAEHVGTRPTPSVLGESPPPAFRAFGVNTPSPYQMSDGQATQEPGTAVAFRYHVTRPGGFQATAVDAWVSSSGAEIWLIVDASPAVTAQVLDTFRAG